MIPAGVLPRVVDTPVRGRPSQQGFLFQPSLPARGATLLPGSGRSAEAISTLAPREGSDPNRRWRSRRSPNFNPRSPRGERHADGEKSHRKGRISTLAPREGSDMSGRRRPCAPGISTLAPREGSDTEVSSYAGNVTTISTLAPREGSDFRPLTDAGNIRISTLAPREGSDSHLVCAHSISV